jgi:hypothetical protein
VPETPSGDFRVQDHHAAAEALAAAVADAISTA